MATAGRVRGLEPGELQVEDGGLKGVEPLVEAGEHVLGLAALAEIADSAREPGEVGVVRADRAGVAERAQVLARVEREGGADAERARAVGRRTPRREPGPRPRRAAVRAGRPAARKRACRTSGRAGAPRRSPPCAARSPLRRHRRRAGPCPPPRRTAPEPRRRGARRSAEAMYVCAGRITSSPGPTPAAQSPIASAAVPEPTPTHSATPHSAAQACSKRATSSPRMNALRRSTRSKVSWSSLGDRQRARGPGSRTGPGCSGRGPPDTVHVAPRSAFARKYTLEFVRYQACKPAICGFPRGLRGSVPRKSGNNSGAAALTQRSLK